MKKSMILLALGLFAAAAFAQMVPVPNTVKPAVDDKNLTVTGGNTIDTTKIDLKTVVLLGDGKTRTIEELKATETERDTLKAQLAEASNVAAIFKQQRNEMASQVMDLTAQVALLRDEVNRLKQPPAKP